MTYQVSVTICCSPGQYLKCFSSASEKGLYSRPINEYEVNNPKVNNFEDVKNNINHDNVTEYKRLVVFYVLRYEKLD